MPRRIGIIRTSPELMSRAFWVYYILTLVRNIIELLETSILGSTALASGVSYLMFLYAVISFLLYSRSNNKAAILFSLVSIITFFKVSSWIFPCNAEYIDGSIKDVLLTCFPHFAIALAIVDFRVLVDRMKQVFPIYILLAWILMGLTYSKVIVIPTNGYMAIAYDVTIPIAISAYIATEKANVKYNLIFAVSAAALLFIGCRGAFIAVAVVYIISLFAVENVSRKLKIAVVFGAGLIASFFNQLLMFFAFLLNSLGYDSRIITRISEGTFFQSSGRDVIRNAAIDFIKSEGYPMYGIFGDRYILRSTTGYASYMHNIALEFIVDYGIYLGIALLVFLSFTIVHTWKNGGNNVKVIFSVFMSISITKLMLSNSYLVDDLFYTAIGLLIAAVGENKKRTVDKRFSIGEDENEKDTYHYI